jgi:predicted transcriptional regulator
MKSILIRKIPDDLHKAVKQLALDTNSTMNDVIIKALEQITKKEVSK